VSLERSGQSAATPKLGIVDLIAEHDVEADEEFPCECDPGFGPSAAMQNREVAAPKIVVRAGGERRRLAEYPAEERAALLSDVSEPLFIGRGIDGWGQADVTHDVLAVGEASDWPEDKNRRQRGQRTDARVGQQELGARIFVSDCRDLFVELVNASGQPGKELEAVSAAACGVRGKVECLQLGETALGPQLRLQRQPLTEGDRLEPILYHGTHANETDPVRDERAAITCVTIGDPHCREAIVLEKLEEMTGITPISLCLADDHRPDLCRLPNHDGVAEAVHERVKPLGIAGGLDADGDGRRQRSVELLDSVAGVGELLLTDFARRGVENGDLLLSRVEITSDECHEIGLLLGSRVTVPQPNPINSGRPFS
jgi:hypothetical protein